MFVRPIVIALFASSATLVKAYTGDGMYLWPFLGIRLISSIATFYSPGLGACGAQSSASDYIVAIAAPTFDSYPYVTCL
jgi:hypothetical protein